MSRKKHPKALITSLAQQHMENNMMKGSLKKMEFHSTITPLRQKIQGNDFFSSQKQKYDQNNTSKLITTTMNNISSNAILNSEACKSYFFW